MLHDADGTPDDAVVDRGVGAPDRLERLWAPYRMQYITDNGAGEESAGSSSSQPRSRNPFVDLPNRSDEDALIVARGELVYCVLNH